ncbi:MAG: hypothetical protein U0U67_12345 [Chitinophagales bacterium]
MKNYFLSAICMTSLLFFSCKKDNVKDNGAVPGENTFVIDGVTYKADNVFYIESSNTLKAQKITSGSPFNNVYSMSVTFSDDDLPGSGGEFKVVNNAYSPGDNTDNDEVELLASTFPHDFGSYYDNNTINPSLSPQQHVTVALKSGKVNVQFSNLKATDVDGKTVSISGNITEP